MQLVLGATGGVGHWVVEKLRDGKNHVRVMVRDPAKTKEFSNMERVEVVEGDATNLSEVKKAIKGADSVYYCVNVPYPEWKLKLIPMLQNTIDAAGEDKAKVVFPGNVYVYGHAQSDFVREDHPFAAQTKKGKIRIRMEQMLHDAWKSEKIPYTIVRFPDFYGPFVVNDLYAPIFRNALQGRSMTWYGKLDIPFEFAYIEDAAEALVMAGLDNGTSGESYNVPGAEVTTPRQWLELVASAAGTKAKIRPVPNFMVALAGIPNPLVREFYEMLYLKEERLILDGTKFRNKFGRIPTTPYDDGIKKTLDWFRINSQLPNLQRPS
jgi:nucleoside-diphosphate-sugar epimerase